MGPALTTPYLQVLFIFICYISLSNSRRHSANADMIANLKSKIIVYHRHFFAHVIVLPLQKFKTIKIKPEKNPYPQTNTCLRHISRNFKCIFKYVCFALYQGSCGTLKTLKTLKSDQVPLKTLKIKYILMINLENLEIRVYYRESFQQCFQFSFLQYKI